MSNVLIYKAIGTGEKQLSAEAFVAALSGINTPVLRFNSPGGSVYEGNTMIANLPKGSRGMVDGLAASMSAFMFLSCEHREMNSRARLMLHLPQVQVRGDASKMRATADELDKMRADFAEIIGKAAGITTDRAIELYLQPGKDTWLTAKESKAAGLIHKITGELTGDIPATAETHELHAIYAQLIDSNHNNKEMDKVKFMAALGDKAGSLTAQSSDDDFIAGVTAIVAENTQLVTANTKLKGEVQAFKDAKAEAEQAEVTALINGAIEDKRITAEQKDAWTAMFKADHENAKALLGGLTPVGSLKNVPDGGAEPTNEELKAEYEAADKKGTLESIKAENKERFKAMYKAKFGSEYSGE